MVNIYRNSRNLCFVLHQPPEMYSIVDTFLSTLALNVGEIYLRKIGNCCGTLCTHEKDKPLRIKIQCAKQTDTLTSASNDEWIQTGAKTLYGSCDWSRAGAGNSLRVIVHDINSRGEEVLVWMDRSLVTVGSRIKSLCPGWEGSAVICPAGSVS